MQAGKAPPIPVETRAADQAGRALSDLKTGGKVRGRTVLLHKAAEAAYRERHSTAARPIVAGDVCCWRMNGLYADLGFLAESDPERTYAAQARSRDICQVLGELLIEDPPGPLFPG